MSEADQPPWHPLPRDKIHEQAPEPWGLWQVVLECGAGPLTNLKFKLVLVFLCLFFFFWSVCMQWDVLYVSLSEQFHMLILTSE